MATNNTGQPASCVTESAKAVCPQCGCEFLRNKQLNKVYCSRACKENAKKYRNWQQQHGHEVKPSPVIKIAKKETVNKRLDLVFSCEFCGASFNPFNRKQRFCSKLCQHKAANLRRNLICAGCGKVFHSVADRTKYCTDCQLKLFGQMTVSQLKGASNGQE